MQILAIDPGTTFSAYVLFDSESETILAKGKIHNDDLIPIVMDTTAEEVVVEHMACMGMSVGKEVFETAYWIGELRRICKDRDRCFVPIMRNQIKLHHCMSVRAKDPNIRQALIDRFGAVGTKKHPGPLYGVSADIWSALAIAVFESDRSRIPTLE
jgi:hypothetical protein